MSRLCLAKRRRYRPAEEERQEPKRGRVCCYVCGRPVSRMNGIAIGQGKWRHKRCRPGTIRWIRHNHGDP